MQTDVLYAKKFRRQLDKTAPKIQKSFFRRRLLLEIDPLHTLLHNHALRGKYEGFRSINVTGDWRAIYLEEIENDHRIIIFHKIGTHSQLYG